MVSSLVDSNSDSNSSNTLIFSSVNPTCFDSGTADSVGVGVMVGVGEAIGVYVGVGILETDVTIGLTGSETMTISVGVVVIEGMAFSDTVGAE
jgi:hypothetical protein